jgi:hypothetical protein
MAIPAVARAKDCTINQALAMIVQASETLQAFFHVFRSANVTPPSVSTMAATSRKPGGCDSRDRTSFAPETTSSKAIKRERIRVKTQRNQRK